MKRKWLVIVTAGLVMAGFWVWQRPKAPMPVRPTGPVVCFGDSLTAGTGASAGMSYPAQLALRIDREVINAGRPGDTTVTAASRLTSDVLARNPAMVIITLGGNDLKNGLPRQAVFERLEAIVRQLQAEGIAVVILGIDLPLIGRGFGSEYEALADRTGTLLLEDIYDGLIGRSDRMSDPIHPNDAGYGLIAQRVAELIRPHL